MLFECEISLSERLVMTWGHENSLGRGGMHLVTASSHKVAGRRKMEMKEDYKIEGSGIQGGWMFQSEDDCLRVFEEK